jgi:Trp operon repressor
MSEEQTPIEIIQSIHDDLWNCSISQKEYESIRSKLLTLRELLTKEKEQREELIKRAFTDGANWELYGDDKTQKERAQQYYNEVIKGRN